MIQADRLVLPFFTREHLLLHFAVFGDPTVTTRASITIDARYRGELVTHLQQEARRIARRLGEGTSRHWSCVRCDRWIRTPQYTDMDAGYWHQGWRWALPQSPAVVASFEVWMPPHQFWP
jgi:hypothetical protein